MDRVLRTRRPRAEPIGSRLRGFPTPLSGSASCSAPPRPAASTSRLPSRSRTSFPRITSIAISKPRSISAGIRSERKLIEIASLNLAHRWYLGYALDEELPDHSSLTRIRQRLGVGVFQRFFDQVVDLCQEAGLVWGRELYVDATKVAANADLDSLIPRSYCDAKAHVAQVFADDPAPTREDTEEGADEFPFNDLLHWPARDRQTEEASGQEVAPVISESYGPYYLPLVALLIWIA
jgi:Transposase domain (DUF772)